MQHFLRYQAWPIVAGLIVAMALTMAFEYANSSFFPLPQNLDAYDTAAVHAFTASLPWTAYILILLGWIAGSFAAGALTTYLSGEKRYRLSCVVGIILLLAGIANALALGHELVFALLSLPLFIVFTYAGHRVMRRS